MDDPISEAELNQALEAMYFGFRALIAEPDARLKSLGMARVHHRILYFVGRNPGCSVGGLLKKLQATKQYVNRPLRFLIEEGYIRAEPDAADRRIKRLRLSSRGEKLEAELSGGQRAHFARVFAAAGPEAQSGWFRVMALLPDTHCQESDDS